MPMLFQLKLSASSRFSLGKGRWPQANMSPAHPTSVAFASLVFDRRTKRDPGRPRKQSLNFTRLKNPSFIHGSILEVMSAMLKLDCACLLHIYNGVEKYCQHNIGSKIFTVKVKFVLIYQSLVQINSYKKHSAMSYVLGASEQYLIFLVESCGKNKKCSAQ